MRSRGFQHFVTLYYSGNKFDCGSPTCALSSAHVHPGSRTCNCNRVSRVRALGHGVRGRWLIARTMPGVPRQEESPEPDPGTLRRLQGGRSARPRQTSVGQMRTRHIAIYSSCTSTHCCPSICPRVFLCSSQCILYTSPYAVRPRGLDGYPPPTSGGHPDGMNYHEPSIIVEHEVGCPSPIAMCEVRHRCMMPHRRHNRGLRRRTLLD